MGEPKVEKAKVVRGRNLVLKDVEVADAEFVLALRSDAGKNKFLSSTSASLEDQIGWIRSYEASTDQAYFIIYDGTGTKVGCVRIYDPIGESFCWGSWILLDGLSPLVALESVLMLYAYALDELGFKSARIDVRRQNESVWRFHEKTFGAVRVHENDLEYGYVVNEQSIRNTLGKFRKLLPERLEIER